MTWTIGWYNGWSPEQRLTTVPVQREAIRDGRLARPDRCSICDARRGDDPSNPIWLHDENYADPLAAYPICRRCHRLLHQRFENPAPWLRLIQTHGDGREWFDLLTMDPASTHVEFAVTYPQGLPRPNAEADVPTSRQVEGGKAWIR